MRRQLSRLGALMIFLVVAGSSPAHAGDREQEQVHRLKLQLRQMQQQQSEAEAQLAADKAALTTTADAAKQEAHASKAVAAQASKRVSALNSELQSVREEKSKLVDQVAQLQKQLEEQKQAWQTYKDDTLAKSLEQKSQYETLRTRYQQCRQDNVQLYDLGSELLTRYENKGLGEVLSAKEPFVQLGRVKLENFAAQYRDKLDVARVRSEAP
ncbi:MAG TPA: hypothetical protein VFM48_08515 [Aquabacterium sp.]|nr:hypothetical protein [Aquabacterium sp.]